MNRFRNLQRLVASIVFVSFCFFGVIVAPVQATMVSTLDILQKHGKDLSCDKVNSFLQRQDVRNYLEAMGVDGADAQHRVNALTGEEIHMLAQQIDQMPAGGDALGTLLGIALVTFVILIILDIAGITDIFSFIKKR